MAAPAEPKYLRQLDGLRAISVALVAWSHWRLLWNLPPPVGKNSPQRRLPFSAGGFIIGA